MHEAAVAEEAAFQMDVRAGDRLFWFADFGWIMGPWEIVGTLANGGTVVTTPDRAPVPCGRKVMLIAQLAPAASVVPQLLLML